MLVEIDYDKICQEALVDVGAYAPGKPITDSDKEAVSLRMSQMLTEDFLIRHLTERIRPLYGVRPETSEYPSIRFTALDMALRTQVYPVTSMGDVIGTAELFLSFLEKGE